MASLLSGGQPSMIGYGGGTARQSLAQPVRSQVGYGGVPTRSPSMPSYQRRLVANQASLLNNRQQQAAQFSANNPRSHVNQYRAPVISDPSQTVGIFHTTLRPGDPGYLQYQSNSPWHSLGDGTWTQNWYQGW